MAGEAPTPHHEAIRRGREAAPRTARAARLHALAIAAQYAVLCVPLLVLAARAWRDGRPWLGTTFFAGGCLLVVGWYVFREFRQRPRR